MLPGKTRDPGRGCLWRVREKDGSGWGTWSVPKGLELYLKGDSLCRANLPLALTLGRQWPRLSAVLS